MADSNASRMKEHDCPNGWSCFFVSAGLTNRGNIMSEVIAMKEKRKAVDVVNDLNMRLGDTIALLDIMATCRHEECDVNGAAFAIQRLVEDAKVLSNKLYHS